MGKKLKVVANELLPEKSNEATEGMTNERLTEEQLKVMTVKLLRPVAKKLDVKNYSTMSKDQLIKGILERYNVNNVKDEDEDENEDAGEVLDPNSGGFLNRSFRNCVFTLNNYTVEEEKAIRGWKYKYLVYGKEVGEVKNVPHLQGYVEWTGSRLGSTLKKINPRISWRKRLGTAFQASMYCKKGEQLKDEWRQFRHEGPNFGLNAQVYERGEISKQGERGCLEDMAHDLESKSMSEVCQENPELAIKYERGLKAYKNMITPHRNPDKPMKIFWRWGLGGSGKSRIVYETFRDNAFPKLSMKWWDGYEQQDVIIWDDFSIPKRDDDEYRLFLKILDRYMFNGEVKGSFVKINSKYMFITCEYPPWHKELFGGEPNDSHVNRRTLEYARTLKLPPSMNDDSFNCESDEETFNNRLFQVLRRIYDSGGDIREIKRNGDLVQEFEQIYDFEAKSSSKRIVKEYNITESIPSAYEVYNLESIIDPMTEVDNQDLENAELDDHDFQEAFEQDDHDFQEAFEHDDLEDRYYHEINDPE